MVPSDGVGTIYIRVYENSQHSYKNNHCNRDFNHPQHACRIINTGQFVVKPGIEGLLCKILLAYGAAKFPPRQFPYSACDKLCI
jgi:hypothetical protein